MKDRCITDHFGSFNIIFDLFADLSDLASKI